MREAANRRSASFAADGLTVAGALLRNPSSWDKLGHKRQGPPGL